MSVQAAMTLERTTDGTGGPWHRVDVCSRTALARTRVRVLGVLDTRAVDAVDSAVAIAQGRAHAVTLELHEITSVTPPALRALLTRGLVKRPPSGS